VSDAITAVLPLRIQAQKHTSDLDRVARLLLPSFDRFWRAPEQLEMLIIVPPGDLDSVTARLGAKGRFPIRVLSEDVVCPALSGQSGWHKQQILKLAAARVVPTRWYLTLDADVMLRRTLGMDDLIHDGKAVFHPKPASRHWDWWLASKSTLHSPVRLDPDMVVMDVTPEVLHRDTTLELLSEIGKRNGAAEPEPFLFATRQVGWTEYSLYWLFVLERRLEGELYRAADPLYEMAWQPEHLASLRQADGSAARGTPSGAPFFIVQSTLEIPLDQAERLIGQLSGDPPRRPPRPTGLPRVVELLRETWRRWR
jgi:hypothetical protein